MEDEGKWLQWTYQDWIFISNSFFPSNRQIGVYNSTSLSFTDLKFS